MKLREAATGDSHMSFIQKQKWLYDNMNAQIDKENADGSVDISSIAVSKFQFTPNTPPSVTRNTITMKYRGFPFPINIVNGSLTVEGENIDSLRNGPRAVIGKFELFNTGTLRSLEHMPQRIMGQFSVSGPYNAIDNLHGIHKILKNCGSIAVGPSITSAILGVMFIKGISYIQVATNHGAPSYWPATGEPAQSREQQRLGHAVEIISHHLRGDRDVHECQEELIEAGLAKFAKL